MQKLGFLHQKALFNSVRKISGQINFGNHKILSNMLPDRSIINSGQFNAAIQWRAIESNRTSAIKYKIKCMLEENVEDLSVDVDDDDELCPVDCVREFYTDEEFLKILEKAKESNALVVVDFYRTSCGSCRYIEQGFAKLCKGSGDEEAPVIFLKHNVIDEYDEQSETADRLRIKTVPLFHFYKNGVLLEAFATRDKERILEAILKYTASASQEVEKIS